MGDKIKYDERNDKFIIFEHTIYTDAYSRGKIPIYVEKTHNKTVPAFHHQKKLFLSDGCLQNCTNNIVLLDEKNEISVYNNENLFYDLLYTFIVNKSNKVISNNKGQFITSKEHIHIYDEKGRFLYTLMPKKYLYGGIYNCKQSNLLVFSDNYNPKKIHFYDYNSNKIINTIHCSMHIYNIELFRDKLIVSDDMHIEIYSVSDGKKILSKYRIDDTIWACPNVITDLCIFKNNILIPLAFDEIVVEINLIDLGIW